MNLGVTDSILDWRRNLKLSVPPVPDGCMGCERALGGVRPDDHRCTTKRPRRLI